MLKFLVILSIIKWLARIDIFHALCLHVLYVCIDTPFFSFNFHKSINSKREAFERQHTKNAIANETTRVTFSVTPMSRIKQPRRLYKLAGKKIHQMIHQKLFNYRKIHKKIKVFSFFLSFSF